MTEVTSFPAGVLKMVKGLRSGRAGCNLATRWLVATATRAWCPRLFRWKTYNNMADGTTVDVAPIRWACRHG